jgi:hypothetical protein
VSDPREFVYELGTTAAIYGVLAALILVGIAIGYAFELRASRSAATFADGG